MLKLDGPTPPTPPTLKFWATSFYWTAQKFFGPTQPTKLLWMGNIQDFYSVLFILVLIRNNRLIVNLRQIFFQNVCNHIEDTVSFSPICVYPAGFFVILFVGFACDEKTDVLVYSWRDTYLYIWIFSRQEIDNLEWV